MHLDSWEHLHRAVSKLMAQLPPGSCLAVTHLTGDYDPAGVARLVAASQQQGTAVVSRTRGEVEEFFAGLELIPPGVVPVTSWRPEASARRGRAGRYVQPRRCRPQARLARRLAAAATPVAVSGRHPDRRRSGPHLQARSPPSPRRSAAYSTRWSNSPSLAPLHERRDLRSGVDCAGPPGHLELRNAIPSPGSRATCRQFPCGLLSMLRHSTPTRRLAGMPL